MSVIQNIQEKYAKLMAIIIAVALIIFVVMLAFENGGNLFRGGNSTSVGKVNGKSIEYADFVKKVDQQKSYMEQQGYGAAGEMLQQQANDAAWNQEVNQAIQNSELSKLGIKVGKKEMGDILYGSNPPDDLKKNFTDSTGVYNAQLAKQQLDGVLKNKSIEPRQVQAREQLIAYINYLESNREVEKYNSLFSNSVNVPKWLVEKETADKSQLAKISLVKDSYAANADSTIKVSDKEIEDYIAKHKDEFKQQESRSIAYVIFNASPSGSDSAAAMQSASDLKAEFGNTNNIDSINRLMNVQGQPDFNNSYLIAANVQSTVKDTLFKLGIGQVFGPYAEGGAYKLSKLLGVRSQPDSVTVRHILISTSQQDPQTGQFYPVRDTAEAKKKIDSIQLAIRNGSNFDTLCSKFSEDGTRDKGGKYENVHPGRMVPAFDNFIFGNPVGAKGVVKTEFGYHYIEILSQMGSSPAYKIATIAKPIEVSSETDNNANTQANQFAGDSRDTKSFDANVEKLKAKGIIKNIQTDITPMAFQVQGIGLSRAFVKKVYKADLGETLDPEKIDDKYVVAIVTEINKEGTRSAAKARIMVEPLLRNKKVAEKLKQKIGTPATLEAAAAILGNKPIETIDSLRMTAEAQTQASANSIAREPKVMGAAFNPANKGKIVVIEGGDGIYVVRVDNVMATSLGDADAVQQRKARIQQAKQQAAYRSPISALRESATVKDKRGDIF
jgi:peptidyl-prolyl cis-trans isomerase D